MGEGAEERSPNRYKNTQHSANMNNAKLGNKMKLGYTFNIGQSKVKPKTSLPNPPPKQKQTKKRATSFCFTIKVRVCVGSGFNFPLGKLKN